MVNLLQMAASLLAASLTTVASSPVRDAGPAISREDKRQTTSFWYANMDHTGNARGYAPDLDGDYQYAVYKAVAPGDGAGIQQAINEGTNGATRHGQWLASQPRVRLDELEVVPSFSPG